jgi:predicted DsbA family dithiol-disulfide isomerase/uncharacterized membrane protein
MSSLRGSALVALGASIALAVDYTRSSAAFCGQYGCAVVKRSITLFGHNPLPWVGISAFAGLFLLSLLASPRLRLQVLVPLALLGGVLGAFFILVQPLMLGAVCPPCMIVDAAALLCAVSAWGFRRAVALGSSAQSGPGQPQDLHRILATQESMRRWAWFTLLSLTVVAPLLWPSVRPATALPAGIRALALPGKIPVVEFADFECPFCRELHPRLTSLLIHYRDKVQYVRLHAPLASHPHARDAAHAAVCAEKQRRGDAMADALYAAPVVSASAARDFARRLGLELGAYDQCLGDPATDARVQADRALLDEAGLEGLPTLFIGSAKLVGAQPDQVLRKELDRALSGQQRAHLPAPLFVGLLGMVAATVIALGHPRRRVRRASPKSTRTVTSPDCRCHATQPSGLDGRAKRS